MKLRIGCVVAGFLLLGLSLTAQTAAAPTASSSAAASQVPPLIPFSSVATDEGGLAVVALDPDFIQTVNTEREYMVIPVPNGDCKGLYVIHKTATSFEARPQARPQGKPASASFFRTNTRSHPSTGQAN
jgi:hypothetical protein